MTLEVRQKLLSEFTKAGIAVIILSIGLYIQRLDYKGMVEKLDNKLTKAEEKFERFILSDHAKAVETLDNNTQVLSRVETTLNK
jgi:hypothetical protein